MESHKRIERKRAILSSAICFCVAAFMVIITAGCYEHHYRAYDPYYHDYHPWNDGETVYYHQWANENHRDPNRDFRKIPPAEQQEYWNWRHAHPDHH